MVGIENVNMLSSTDTLNTEVDYTKYIILLVIVLIMYLIPYSIKGNAVLYVYFFSIVALIGILTKIKGAAFLLLAISLCMPSGWLGTSGLKFHEVDVMNSAFDKCIRFLLLGVSFVILFTQKIYREKSLFLLIVSYIFVGIVYSLLADNRNELYLALRVCGGCYGFFIICYNDKKITINDIFICLDVLFIISLFYGILDYILHQSPYQFITNATTNINTIGRARGILGHPLYLSGWALVYQAIIYVRYYITKKFGYIQELLCVVMSLIVVSRTTIIILILEYVLFVFLSEGYKKKFFILVNLFFLVIVSLFIVTLYDSVVVDIFTRFENGTITHREGAYEAIWNLFKDNPLGVGRSNIMDEIRRQGFGNGLFDQFFSTVDNLFLSQIGGYGILAFIPIIYYFYLFYDAFKIRKHNPLLFKIILTLYVPYTLEAFSFDWETKLCLCMLLFGFMGYMYRYCLLYNETSRNYSNI